jgi:hypothetical protein
MTRRCEGYRGVYHRARIRATRWLDPSCGLEQSAAAAVETAGTQQNAVMTISGDSAMELILIIVLVLFLFGGGGYWGRRRGHW